MCSFLLRATVICVATGLETACAESTPCPCVPPAPCHPRQGTTKASGASVPFSFLCVGFILTVPTCGRRKDACPYVEVVHDSSVWTQSMWVGSRQGTSCHDLYASKLCRAPAACTLSSGSSSFLVTEIPFVYLRRLFHLFGWVRLPIIMSQLVRHLPGN